MPGIRIHGEAGHEATGPPDRQRGPHVCGFWAQRGQGLKLLGDRGPVGHGVAPPSLHPCLLGPSRLCHAPPRGPVGGALRSREPPRGPVGGCPELDTVLCCPVCGSRVSPTLPAPQYIDAISSKQGELENYVSDGYKTALTEERRRFCFLVEKQCAVAKNSAAYHSKVSSAGHTGAWAEADSWQPPSSPSSGLSPVAVRTCPPLSCVERNAVHFGFPQGWRAGRRGTGQMPQMSLRLGRCFSGTAAEPGSPS